MKTSKRYSPIERERAVGLVFDQQHQHSSQWSAIESIAGKIGCTLETLRRWVGAEQCTQYAEKMGLYQRMLKQKRGDKNKLYSLHESHVYCMSKGKAHQRYEFSTKASITTTRDSGRAGGVGPGETTVKASPYHGHSRSRLSG